MSSFPLVESKEEGEGESIQQRIHDKLRYNNESLDFYDEGIGDLGVRVVVDELQNNTMITQLWLSKNRIGNEGCENLEELLKASTSLKILDLAYNNIGDRGAQMIAAGLEQNSSLTMLYLSNNVINDSCEALDKVNFYLALNEAGRQTLLENNKDVDITHEEWVDEVIEFCFDERLEDHKLSCFLYCLFLRPGIVYDNENNINSVAIASNEGDKRGEKRRKVING